jgi:hypothetical protein
MRTELGHRRPTALAGRRCRRDYFVLIRVEADRIVSVEVDPSRPGHLA